MERIDINGIWTTTNDGGTWVLEEPSEFWEATRRGTVRDDGSVLIDNGDGTGTEIYYDPDGVETRRVKRTDLEIPTPPAPADDGLDQVRQLGRALLADPALFASLVAGVAPTNTAKGPLVYVADAITTAADSTPPTAQGGDQP